MNDEVTMDRKVYALNPPSKSSIQEQSNRPARQQQDGSGSSQSSKSYSRPPNRRREPLFGNSYGSNTRYDSAGRKPTSQKNKVVDKRPRNRGVNDTEAIDPHHEEPEIGSIHAPGGKKQNLNHLLNFHFAPRETRVFSAGSWHSHNTHPGGNRRSQFGGSVNRPKFNKEQFLQANCQFMVKSTGDYTVYKSDPDLLVEWNSVEQIYIRTIGATPHCPICLSPPVAAKMTRCGHIFCWPCLLHYLALSDKQFRKCPICYEPVHKDDLKSVVSKLCADVQVGDEVELQLMCRPKDSFISMPLMCKNGAAIEWESVFSKLLDVTPNEVLTKVISREKDELTALYEEDKNCPEACFIEQALQELEIRRNAVISSDFMNANQSRRLEVASSLGLNNCLFKESVIEDVKKAEFEKYEKQIYEGVGVDSLGGNGSDDDSLNIKSLDLDGYYMFYQAVGGQNLFLHPLNMAMLWKGFGEDPTQWPQLIQLKVIEKESMTMTEEMKKRLRFLRHLPITTSFHLVEVEIKSSMIAEAVLIEFKGQLESRKKRRAHRIRDEKRRERLREAEERKAFGHFPAHLKIESKFDFPDCGRNEEFEGYEEMLFASLMESQAPTDNMNKYFDENDSNKQLSLGIPIIDNKSPMSDCSTLSTSPSVSFAQVVSQKATVKRSTTYPGAWGSVLSAKDSHVSPANKTSEGDQDNEDYVPVPEFRNSVSDAIAKAFANIQVNDDNESSNSGQKKKKKKGKVLFSTGMGGLK